MYELQCIEFDQELAAAEHEPFIQEALRKELKQNELFYPLFRSSFKDISTQIRDMNDLVLNEVNKLKFKIDQKTKAKLEGGSETLSISRGD